MTASDFEQQAPVSAFGAALRAEWLEGLRQHADMATSASVAAHGQSEDHRVVQAGQQGLFGHMSATEMGAAVAARQTTIGSEWGPGRPLERNGGLYDHNSGPAPSRVDLRHVHAPGGQQPTGESPLARWHKENR